MNEKSLEKVSCNICRSTKQKNVLAAKDPFTGETFTVVRCESCGLLYTSPRPTSMERPFYYPHTLYTADPSIEEKKKILLEYASQGRILDVGCGRGFFLNSIKHRFEVTGVEIEEESLQYASKKHGIKIKARQISDLDSAENSFDVITFWHTLEHLPDPKEALEKAHALLKNKGLLFVAVPNIASLQACVFQERWYHLDVPRHLYHFSQKTLSRIIEDSGFTIKEASLTLFSHNFEGFWRSCFKTLGLKYEFLEMSKIEKIADPRWYVSKILRYIFYVPSYILTGYERKQGKPGTIVCVASK
jgi:2-polyprenyl-3-methyl-5-hydroxy-6-metoxy-1,4-benzoquinol methylase